MRNLSVKICPKLVLSIVVKEILALLHFNLPMRNTALYSIIFLLFATACQNGHKVKLRGDHMLSGVVIGDSVSDNIKTVESLLAIIQDRNTVKITVKGVVKDVAKKDGNWLKLENHQNEEIFVQFVDPSLYFPQDIVNKVIVLDGEARYETLSVERQRELATENNDTGLEIEKITTSKEVVFFRAKGATIL